MPIFNLYRNGFLKRSMLHTDAGKIFGEYLTPMKVEDITDASLSSIIDELKATVTTDTMEITYIGPKDSKVIMAWEDKFNL